MARGAARRTLLGLCLGTSLFGPAERAPAQDVKASGAASPAVAARAVGLFNASGTIRVTGEFRVPPGGEIEGDVAVLGGPLTIAGRVRGGIIVINGDARLEPGAEILGPLTVIGGMLERGDGTAVTGPVLVRSAPLRVRVENGRLVEGVAPRRPALSAGYDLGFGRTDMMLAVRHSYNRVEGLPVAFGPRFEFGGANPTRFESLLIYRTESGLRFDADELGYVVRLEQFLGGRHSLRVGALARSEVVPIEAWGLGDPENSLATFLLHRDYRDHYEREGWAGYLRLAPPMRPYELTFEYREEQHHVASTEGPWSLVDNHAAWRPQPIVAEGVLRSVALDFRYDTRNIDTNPSAGWRVRATLERGLGGTLAHPVTLNPAGGGPMVLGERPAQDEFISAFLDARRYVRVGPESRLGIRVLAAGSIDGGALPPQRQHALGGEGSLPGYGLFTFDCGARGPGNSQLFPFYGCDRIALLQLEYGARLPFGHDWADRLDWGLGLGGTPHWFLFFDAGRAWTEPAARGQRLPGPNDFAADAGLGLRLGRLGVYWAVPLTGEGQGINFFVRIGPRF